MKLRYKFLAAVAVLLATSLAVFAIVLSHDSACAPAPQLAAQSEPMKAVVYRCYGSPDVLQFEEVEKPVPAEDEVLVRVHAAAVNPLDWHYMRGSPYIMRLISGLGAPADNRLGVDFAGTVESVGSAVTRFQPGDEVFGGAGGAFSEYVSIRESRALAHKPATISFEQAAGVPIAAVTALQALRDKGRLQPGQKVLVNGASGGVGTFAVQIAKSLGAEVTGVCSTRNVQLVSSLGADHVFDYTREDYTRSGQQYDLIVDNVGNHSLLANAKVLKPGGILVIVGGSKGDWLGPLLRPIQGWLLSLFMTKNYPQIMARLNGEDLALLGDLMQRGEVVSVIDRRYRLSEVPAAISYSEEGHARGKIIVSVHQDPAMPSDEPPVR